MKNMHPNFDVERATEKFNEVKKYIDTEDFDAAIFLLEDFKISIDNIIKALINWKRLNGKN